MPNPVRIEIRTGVRQFIVFGEFIPADDTEIIHNFLLSIKWPPASSGFANNEEEKAPSEEGAFELVPTQPAGWELCQLTRSRSAD